MRKRWRRWLVRILKGIAWFLGILAAYFGLAWSLGSIPVNRDWKQPAEGIEIYVLSNGLHTDLILPTRTQQMDWFAKFPFEHFTSPWPGAAFVEIGWGDRGFFLEARTWADVRTTTLLQAVFFLGSSAMHVGWSSSPSASENCKLVRLTSEQYSQLCAFVLRSFQTDAQGRLQPILGKGYDAYDTFYEALGTYSFVYTCNSWTNEALKVIGVRAALWSPLVGAVMSKL